MHSIITTSTSSTCWKHVSSENTVAERIKHIGSKEAKYQKSTTLKKKIQLFFSDTTGHLFPIYHQYCEHLPFTFNKQD